jgi:hypothetical protein
VPASVRIGSPYDARDRVVYRLAKRGFLHPRTNYGVVYRIAFARDMEPGETPAPEAPSALPVDNMPTSLIMRFGWVVPPDRFAAFGDTFEVTEKDIQSFRIGAWVLLTSHAIRWHYTGDGAPQVHPGIDSRFGGGLRRLAYGELGSDSTHNQVRLLVSGTPVDVDFFVFDSKASFHAFGFAGAFAPENLNWYDFVRDRAHKAR